MQCQVCRNGHMEKGLTTITLERDGSVLVFKQAPAFICDNCGEEYVEDEITQQLMQQAEATLAHGAQFDVRQYRAA